MIFTLLLLLLPMFLQAQSDSLNITWNRNPETDMSHYLLDSRTDAGAFTQIANVPHPTTGTTVTTSHRPTVPLAGHRYSYRVRAVDTGGLTSVYSDTAGTGIPLITVSAVPAVLTGPVTIPLGNIFSDPIYPTGTTAQTSLVKAFSNQVNCTVAVVGTNLVITPTATSGTGSFIVTLTDPDLFFDRRTITFTINVNVAPTAPAGVTITR